MQITDKITKKHKYMYMQVLSLPFFMIKKIAKIHHEMQTGRHQWVLHAATLLQEGET